MGSLPLYGGTFAWSYLVLGSKKAGNRKGGIRIACQYIVFPRSWTGALSHKYAIPSLLKEEKISGRA